MNDFIDLCKFTASVIVGFIFGCIAGFLVLFVLWLLLFKVVIPFAMWVI